MADRTYLARVIRREVDGEQVDVHLQLIRDDQVVEVNDGDEFVTVGLKVDPFEKA